MSRTIVALLLLLVSLHATPVEAAEPLCPRANEPGDVLDQLKRPESDFSEEKAKAAVETFRTFLRPELESPCVADWGCDNHYAIIRHNARQTIRGFLLREEAVLECRRLELLASREPAPKHDLSRARSSCADARTAFCTFLAQAYAAD